MNHTLSGHSILLYRDFLAYTTRRLQALGLNFGSMPFVLYLGKHPDCSPSQLTSALQMDWGHSQRSLTRLEEGGFLTRTKEGRSYRLQLTEKGSAAFSLCHQVFEDWDRETLAALSAQEQQTLLQLLQKLTPCPQEEPHV